MHGRTKGHYNLPRLDYSCPKSTSTAIPPALLPNLVWKG